MPKTRKKSNFRVEVYPYALLGQSHESENDLLNKCEEIKRQIKRHIDGIGSCDVDYDTELICSYCSFIWEELEDYKYYYIENHKIICTMSPCCCDRAVREWEAKALWKILGDKAC